MHQEMISEQSQTNQEMMVEQSQTNQEVVVKKVTRFAAVSRDSCVI